MRTSSSELAAVITAYARLQPTVLSPEETDVLTCRQIQGWAKQMSRQVKRLQ